MDYIWLLEGFCKGCYMIAERVPYRAYVVHMFKLSLRVVLVYCWFRVQDFGFLVVRGPHAQIVRLPKCRRP